MGRHAAASAPKPMKQGWGFRSIRWGQIFRYQTHGGWIVILAAGIVAAISHFSIHPDYRPLTVYDASISLPNHPDTVSIFMAGIIPAAALVITVAAVEFGAMYKRQSLTMAIHAFCHIIWWGIIGFAVVLAITEATKPWASRYRPDYMARCNPSQRKAQVLVAAGKPLGFAEQTDCDPSVQASDFVKDGRKSFPSGHSSNSMSLCWFTVLYLVHALYWRDGMRYMGSIWGSSGCGRRFLAEVLQGLFIVWGLTVLTIAWCIGVTRFRDNRHNIDDILGGFVAALLWMTPCTAIALGQLNYFQQKLSKDETTDTLPVVAPTMAPGSAAAVSATDKANGPATTAPTDMSAPARYGSIEHVVSGKGNVVHPEPAAAADDTVVTPAHAHPALTHLTSLAHAGPESEVVVPVADANGLPSKRTF